MCSSGGFDWSDIRMLRRLSWGSLQFWLIDSHALAACQHHAEVKSEWRCSRWEVRLPQIEQITSSFGRKMFSTRPINQNQMHVLSSLIHTMTSANEALINGEPSAISSRWSAINHKPSGASYQRSATTDDETLVISHQASSAMSQWWAIRDLLSVMSQSLKPADKILCHKIQATFWWSQLQK